jgi:ComF family protein
MSQVLQSQPWKIDLVCPVPLGVARQADRGFNQAALLARPIALSSGLTYSPHAVERKKETLSQVGLNFERRHNNVSDAFQAKPAVARGRTVLIVDDVATSGATLEACALALLEAGARQVYALTLARAALEQA